MGCQNKVDGKCCGEECASKDYDAGSPVYIDIERMEKALKSGSITIPQGLTREQIRDFILSHAEPTPELELTPIEKLKAWASKEHCIYRDEIIQKAREFGVDEKIINIFERHTMYRWYGSEVIDVIGNK